MNAAPPESSSASARLRRRFGWNLADQAVTSAASLTVGLIVAHEAALDEIGAFAVAFGFYQLLHAVGRPLISEPLAITYSALESEQQREPAAKAAGSALALGALIAPFGLLGEFVVGGGTGRALAVCALFAPVFLLQDAWRYVFFTRAKPALAVVSDLLVLAALVPIAVLFQALMGDGGATFVAAWGTSTTLGALACLAYTRLWPRVGAALAWWRETTHLGRQMLTENLLVMGSYFAAVSLIALIAGSGQLGRLRVTQVAFSPASFVILAAGAIVLTEGSRLHSAAPHGIRGLAAAMGAAVIGTTTLLAALWLALPADIGADIVGPAWPSSQRLVVPASLYLGALGLTTVLSMTLRAAKVPERAMRSRALAAPWTMAGALGGALVSGPGLAIFAMGAVELACAAAMLLALLRLPAEGGAARSPAAVLAAARLLGRRPDALATRLAVRVLMRSPSREFAFVNSDGHRMLLDCRDHMGANAVMGRYRLPGRVVEAVRPGDWVIDLGANVGIVSSQLCAAVGPSGLVSAWEPIKRNVERLRFLRDENGLGQLSVVPYAAGSEDWTTSIGLAGRDRSGWSSMTASWHVRERVDVVVRRVDAFQEPRARGLTLRLIKVDVEGYEFEALEGCRGLLEEHRPWIYCEFNDFVLRDRGKSAGELLEFLATLGYQPVEETPGLGRRPVNVLLGFVRRRTPSSAGKGPG